MIIEYSLNGVCLGFQTTTFSLFPLHPSSELFFGRVNCRVVGGEQAEAVKIGMGVNCLPNALSLLCLPVFVRTVEMQIQCIG